MSDSEGVGAVDEDLQYEHSGGEESGEDDLEGVGQSTTKALNIKTTYQPNWGGKEAFREFYQNWRDGIVKKFLSDIVHDVRDFKTTYKETSRAIVIEARHPSDNMLMGYIRFRWDKDEVGVLKLVNFKASLQLQHLGLGGTTKATDNNQAGQFGEGMKIAALVLKRSPLNHAVQLGASKYMWTFLFSARDKTLHCQLRRAKDITIRREKSAEKERISKGQPRELKSHIWEDVAVTIGASRIGRTSSGEKRNSVKVSLQAFRDWLTVTIDVSPPSEKIRTSHGDLILDPKFENKTYLKGLLLLNPSASGKKFRFGYNFLNGTTGRDRANLANARDEARKLAGIWGEALSTDNDSSETSLVAKYTRMLREELQSSADVSEADQFVPESAVKKIWAYLIGSNHGNGDNLRPFYYFSSGGTHDAHIIRECLKREPVLLSKQLWDMFTKYSLCRTPERERHHLFLQAKKTVLPSTCFFEHISRCLKACLASHPVTADMGISFVHTENLRIDAVYTRSSKELKIDDKWLTYEGAHEQNMCDFGKEEMEGLLKGKAAGLFLCDHAVASLCHKVMDVFEARDIGDVSLGELKACLGSIVSIRISQMPRAVEVSRTSKDGELLVTWTCAERNAVADRTQKMLQVVLHRAETCAHTRASLLFKEDTCGCIKQARSLRDRSALFKDLDPTKAYFPMISRAESGAFYGLPPKGAWPVADPNISAPSAGPPKWTQGGKLDIRTQDWGGRFPGNHDWYHASNSLGGKGIIAQPKDQEPEGQEPDIPSARSNASKKRSAKAKNGEPSTPTPKRRRPNTGSKT
ncbi:hypothetical protein BU16DRAFT_606081 [Lophium mytilinum]|uniref:Uncharacterized protein n=1 Tax=Lophium mytilinum TaxID=390894 RepID=A0A6A6QYL7_9PEZI|nr:hypothetical protein BU16DRAFT_606081 [Lophium mytilinum]